MGGGINRNRGVVIGIKKEWRGIGHKIKGRQGLKRRRVPQHPSISKKKKQKKTKKGKTRFTKSWGGGKAKGSRQTPRGSLH